MSILILYQYVYKTGSKRTHTIIHSHSLYVHALSVRTLWMDALRPGPSSFLSGALMVCGRLCRTLRSRQAVCVVAVSVLEARRPPVCGRDQTYPFLQPALLCR